jgi:hypothetical protein
MDQLLDLEALNKLTPEQQEKVIQGVRQQAAIVHAQNLITVWFGFKKITPLFKIIHSALTDYGI